MKFHLNIYNKKMFVRITSKLIKPSIGSIVNLSTRSFTTCPECKTSSKCKLDRKCNDDIDDIFLCNNVIFLHNDNSINKQNKSSDTSVPEITRVDTTSGGLNFIFDFCNFDD